MWACACNGSACDSKTMGFLSQCTCGYDSETHCDYKTAFIIATLMAKHLLYHWCVGWTPIHACDLIQFASQGFCNLACLVFWCGADVVAYMQ